MQSYGGIPLVQPGAQFAAWMQSYCPVQDVFDFFRRPWLGRAPVIPNNNWFLSRGVRLNTFFNPWGASRWGIAYVLADDTMLEAINALVYAGSDYLPLPFVIDDDFGNSLTTNLWMLPPVPLSKIEMEVPPVGTTAQPRYGRWLLVLVDERFFWWEKQTESLDYSSWALLYSTIATALGITLTNDTIAAAYLTPDTLLVQNYDYLPQLLDYAASSIGQRVVRNLDGTFRARSASAALDLQTTQVALYRKYSGGTLSLGIVDA